MWEKCERMSWLDKNHHMTLDQTSSVCLAARASGILSGNMRMRTRTRMNTERGSHLDRMSCLAGESSRGLHSLARFDAWPLKMAEKWKYLSWQRGRGSGEFLGHFQHRLWRRDAALLPLAACLWFLRSLFGGFRFIFPVVLFRMMARMPGNVFRLHFCIIIHLSRRSFPRRNEILWMAAFGSYLLSKLCKFA